MKETDKYVTLVDNTFLISIGTFGSRLLTFFMMRFYTDMLTPSDYGTADLVIQTANLLLPLVSMGITDSVFRFALKDPMGRARVFSVGFFTISAGALFLMMASPTLSAFSGFRGVVWLIVVYTIASCYHSLCAQFVRAQGKMALFAGQGIINTAMVISFNILFLAVFRWGTTGYVFSIVAADILCSAFLVVKEKLWRQMMMKPGKPAFVHMLRYSSPLIPTTVFWWITSVSDRYMITAFLGSDANGLYAVACKIPTLLTLVAGMFLEAWQFSAISESGGRRREQVRFFTRIWGGFMAVMFLAGSVVIAFSQWEIRLLSAQGYHEAWRYVPVLSAAMIFSSFVTFMGSVYVVKKKSLISFWTAMAGAGINLMLNGLLIPSGLGIQGAAVATAASYTTVFLLRARSARRLMPFRLYKGRLAVNSLILCCQVISAMYTPFLWQVIQAICVAALLLINGRELLTAVKKVGHLKLGKGRHMK